MQSQSVGIFGGFTYGNLASLRYRHDPEKIILRRAQISEKLVISSYGGSTVQLRRLCQVES